MSRIIPGVTDVPALLAHREMVYFSMQEKITFLHNISQSPSLQMYNEGYFSLLGTTVYC